MAGDASGLADEELEAGDFVRLQSRVVALHPAVEAGFGRNERALEARQRGANVGLGRARVIREGRREPAHARRVGGEARCGLGDVAAAHLARVLDRPAHLRLQRRRPSVPEEGQAPGEIPQGRRPARQRLAVVAGAARHAVRERQGRIVARRAGDIARAREARIAEKAAPEIDFFRRDRVAGGRRNGLRADEGGAPSGGVEGFGGAALDGRQKESGEERRRSHASKPQGMVAGHLSARRAGAARCHSEAIRRIETIVFMEAGPAAEPVIKPAGRTRPPIPD